MIRAVLLACGFCLCVQPGQAQTSQLKGLAAVSRELSTRIAHRDAPLELHDFVPTYGLEEMLGAWGTFGSEHTFRNGAPNSLNMVIWRVTLSRFADAVGESCAAPGLVFNPRFLAVFRKLCAWPAAEAKSDAVLLEFWLGVMGYNAPEAEYVAWRDFFRRAYAQRPAAETVTAMTLAITMNPYFLLHK